MGSKLAPNNHPKPWQVVIDYHPVLGGLVFRPRHHVEGSIMFTDRAAERCGGAAEYDEYGYIIRCHDEYEIVDVAREIARLSEIPDLVESSG